MTDTIYIKTLDEMAPYLEQANREGRQLFFIVEEQKQQLRSQVSEESYGLEQIFMAVFFALFLYIMYRKIKASPTQPDEPDLAAAPVETHMPFLLYQGYKLKFTNDVLDTVLLKYSPYYTGLGELHREKFIQRLQKFIAAKLFIIYSDEGYREMPILISAAAIQITFGLEKYLLDHFPNIAVYPQEYIKTDPLRVLIGNVQGNTISLSWKHFLHDFNNKTDGRNVGLHEMAHALQLQNMLPGKKTDHEFLEDFKSYDQKGADWLLTEQLKKNSLFDKYALCNKDEFWAASIELFFERPAVLKIYYPMLYTSLCDVLNQNSLDAKT